MVIEGLLGGRFPQMPQRIHIPLSMSEPSRSFTADFMTVLLREHGSDCSFRCLVGVGGFVPSAKVKDVVEKGLMNFVFEGNGFAQIVYRLDEGILSPLDQEGVVDLALKQYTALRQTRIAAIPSRDKTRNAKRMCCRRIPCTLLWKQW